MYSFKVTKNNDRVQSPNIIGYIQRGIKLNKIYGNQHKYEISKYFKEIPRFKKITKEDIMKAMQRMVRAKYKGYRTIKLIIGFIPNPNPNSKR